MHVIDSAGRSDIVLPSHTTLIVVFTLDPCASPPPFGRLRDPQWRLSGTPKPSAGVAMYDIDLFGELALSRRQGGWGGARRERYIDKRGGESYIER